MGAGVVALLALLLPLGLLGNARSERRVKRGWVWNQFFVLEEYTGLEPLYIGKERAPVPPSPSTTARATYTPSNGWTASSSPVRAPRSGQEQVTDRPLEPESEFIVKIQDINDNEPRFGRTLHRLCARDVQYRYLSDPGHSHRRRRPDLRNSARVVYSVLEGQPYFSVDAKTGVVRVSLADMDRETRENYTVLIQAKDMGGQDRDTGPNAHMRYSIVDGDGRDTFDISTDPTRAFGIITVKRLHSEGGGANTEVEPALRHRGPFTDVTIVHVSIEDVDEPPVFQLSAYLLELPEDAEIGTVIRTVSARDPDAANNTVRYSIDKGSDLEKFFYIELTTGALMTLRTLDREQVGWHNITVLAMEMRHRFHYSLGPESKNNPNFTLRDNQDNSAWILTRRGGWALRDQTVFFLPISVWDGEEPVQSSTSTLTIRAYTLPANLSRGALIAILACIFVLLVLILLMLSLRTHRKKTYLCDEEENVHENIVRYDDEGGGEEDTEAFDISAMWNPREVHPHAKLRQDMLPEIQSLSRYVPQACVFGPSSGDGNVQGYVLAKLLEADLDPCAPPYDSLQTYAYEGEGSVAESLSSLQSGASNADHEYDYLNDWGRGSKSWRRCTAFWTRKTALRSGRRKN
ncbi:hypothetical protein WMY93_029558 [Mugilogobius chulae]|uniref:Cadherin-20 n=1 Tax=Mugilogobius chulae TaxID=88201 RepID=A0AAW0MW73_9GOBI